MKQIDIQDQARLGFLRTLSMTVNGMRHRLGRSVVTILVIVVAIAFLMNTLSESLLKRSVAERLDQHISELRATANLATHLSQPEMSERLVRRVAEAHENDAVSQELQSLGGFDDVAVAELSSQASRAIQILDWLQRLNYGHRRRLIHNAEGIEVFERLREPAHLQRFESGLRAMPSLRLPITIEQLESFLEEWPRMRNCLERIRVGWQQASDHLAGEIGDRSMIQALTNADGTFGDQVRQAGFQLDSVTAGRIAEQARQMLDTQHVEQTIAVDALRKAISQKLDILPGEVDPHVLWRLLGTRSSALWYIEKMSEQGFRIDDLTTERLVELSSTHAEERTIASVAWVYDSADHMILNQRMIWLIGVSLIVCMAGITNAMLMSVTQRFREIATMKCLGALDSYIALAFILEACMLGLAGGLMGAIVGLMIGMGRMFGTFGSLLAGAIPAVELLQTMGAALVLGVLLAALATVLPALKAARLAPMEAMRVE